MEGEVTRKMTGCEEVPYVPFFSRYSEKVLKNFNITFSINYRKSKYMCIAIELFIFNNYVLFNTERVEQGSIYSQVVHKAEK